GLSIVQNAAAYTGATQIYSGELVVAEAGRLAVTNEINVYAGGSLVVDNLPSDGAVSDRIDDNVPINLVGGELSVWPTQWGMNSHERVGTVTLKRGVSTIRGTHYFENSRESHADLSIAELVREPGATVSIVTTNRR